MIEKFRLLTWVNIMIVAIFVMLVFSQANKKFMLDEIDFPSVATTISKTGLPNEYRGEARPFETVEKKKHSGLGLWHPPLYAYSLGAFVKAFGSNENTVRAFGMYCTLLSAILCLLVYREIFQLTSQVSNQVATVFLSIFLLHPYTLANTTLPDIDSTILPVTILIFIYGTMRTFRTKEYLELSKWSAISCISMPFLFALTLWSKLTTPLVLIPMLVLILHIKSFSWRRSIFYAGSVAVFGCIIFLVTYGVFCYLLNLPFDFTFKFLVHSFTKNATSGEGVASLLSNLISHLSYLQYFVNWLGTPFLIALTLACCGLLLQRLKSEGDKIILVLAGLGLFVTMFYLALTGAFGGFFKYAYPVFPILMLVTAHYIHRHLSMAKLDAFLISISCLNITIRINHRRGLLILSLVIASLVCFYQLVVAKDIAILENRPVTFEYICLVIGIAILAAILSTRKVACIFFAYGVAIIFAVMVGAQFGISRSQAVAIYPTKYHYGQLGFDETISYLKARLKPNEPIWSMKDIGYYANTNYFENYGYIFKSAAEITHDLDWAIKDSGVRYLVVTNGIGQDRVDAYAELKLALGECCLIDQEFGNFIIYKAKHYE